MLKVPLDQPVTKTKEDGTFVVYDHLWLTSMYAGARNPAQPANVRVTLRKARDLPDGSKEFYMDEPEIVLLHNDFFAMAAQNPSWAIMLIQIISVAKLWAREQNIAV